MTNLHHYDVYLRASHGTVKRMVSLTKRSTKAAGEKARHDIQRTTREPVKVLDVVPLRCIKGKASEQGRGRKHMKVTKTRFVQTRRPKARASLKLTRKGKLYTPRNIDPEKGPIYTVGRVTEGLSEKEAPPRTCESDACKARGSCTHSLPSAGKHFLVLVEVTVRPKGTRSLKLREGFIWVQNGVVRNREQAAVFAQEFFKARGGVVSVKVLDTFTDAAAKKAGLHAGPRNYFRQGR